MVSVSKLIIRLFAGILALIFLAVTILGIILVITASYYASLGIGVIVFGVVGLVVAFAGCCGAGFEKDESAQSSVKIKGFFLVLFFAVMLILDIALIFFGVGCLCLRPTVYVIIGAAEKPNDLHLKGTLLEQVEFIQKILLGIGIAVIILSAIILLVVGFAAYRMGVGLFSKFFITTAAIIQSIIGLALSIFLLFENSKLDLNKYDFFPHGVFISVVVFGFVLFAIGFLGFWSVCVGSRLKCVSAFYNIFNIIVFLGFVSLFVTLVVFRAVINKAVEDHCNSNTTDECIKGDLNFYKNYCKKEEQNCPKKKYVDALVEMVGGWVTLLMVVCMVLVAFLTLVVISTCVNCFRKPSDEDKKGKYNQFPDYSYY